jgi:hypothetical protein
MGRPLDEGVDLCAVEGVAVAFLADDGEGTQGQLLSPGIWPSYEGSIRPLSASASAPISEAGFSLTSGFSSDPL